MMIMLNGASKLDLLFYHFMFSHQSLKVLIGKCLKDTSLFDRIASESSRFALG